MPCWSQCNYSESSSLVIARGMLTMTSIKRKLRAFAPFAGWHVSFLTDLFEHAVQQHTEAAKEYGAVPSCTRMPSLRLKLGATALEVMDCETACWESAAQDIRFNLNLSMAHIMKREFNKAIVPCIANGEGVLRLRTSCDLTAVCVTYTYRE